MMSCFSRTGVSWLELYNRELSNGRVEGDLLGEERHDYFSKETYGVLPEALLESCRKASYVLALSKDSIQCLEDSSSSVNVLNFFLIHFALSLIAINSPSVKGSSLVWLITPSSIRGRGRPNKMAVRKTDAGMDSHHLSAAALNNATSPLLSNCKFVRNAGQSTLTCPTFTSFTSNPDSIASCHKLFSGMTLPRTFSGLGVKSLSHSGKAHHIRSMISLYRFVEEGVRRKEDGDSI